MIKQIVTSLLVITSVMVLCLLGGFLYGYLVNPTFGFVANSPLTGPVVLATGLSERECSEWARYGHKMYSGDPLMKDVRLTCVIE